MSVPAAISIGSKPRAWRWRPFLSVDPFEGIYKGLRVIGFERSASIAFVVKGNTVDILRILPRGMDIPSDWAE